MGSDEAAPPVITLALVVLSVRKRRPRLRRRAAAAISSTSSRQRVKGSESISSHARRNRDSRRLGRAIAGWRGIDTDSESASRCRARQMRLQGARAASDDEEMVDVAGIRSGRTSTGLPRAAAVRGRQRPTPRGPPGQRGRRARRIAACISSSRELMPGS
jgi:hypothetical protein